MRGVSSLSERNLFTSSGLFTSRRVVKGRRILNVFEGGSSPLRTCGSGNTKFVSLGGPRLSPLSPVVCGFRSVYCHKLVCVRVRACVCVSVHV